MKTLLMMLMLVSLAACGKNPGPAGPQGPVGPQGPAGPVGANGNSNVIFPCGYKDGVKNEFLLMLSDGSVAKECCHHGHCELQKLAPGPYVTDDEKKCAYTVNADNTVTW